MLSKNLIFIALVPIVGALGYWKGYNSMENRDANQDVTKNQSVKVSKEQTHWFAGTVEQGFEKAQSYGLVQRKKM